MDRNPQRVHIQLKCFVAIVCGCEVEVRVDRDPQRLLRPTEGWTERQRDSGPSGNGPVLHMQHRSVSEVTGLYSIEVVFVVGSVLFLRQKRLAAGSETVDRLTMDLSYACNIGQSVKYVVCTALRLCLLLGPCCF